MKKPHHLNGFFLFARTFKLLLDECLGRAITIEAACDRASPFWEGLTDNERAYWKQRAKEERDNPTYQQYRNTEGRLHHSLRAGIYEYIPTLADRNHRTIVESFEDFESWYY